MSEVTCILSAIDQGDRHAAEQLLPVVYDELRKLAAQKLAQEKPGQTLQATALVHDAYLRLLGSDQAQEWNGRGHFFAAAAEAMRRILVERVRHKRSLKAGGDRRRQELADIEVAVAGPRLDLLALDEALTKLAQQDQRRAELVKLRFFAGLTIAEAARVLGVSDATADNDWAYARSWLRLEIEGNAGGGGLYVTGSGTALALVSLTGVTVQNDLAVGRAGGGVGGTFFTAGSGGSGGSANGGAGGSAFLKRPAG
jgi:RNA polymerase sigma factor (TIGR02999 family)